VLAAVEQVVDTASVLVLRLFAVEGDDSEVDVVLAHEGDGQAGEGTAEQYEDHGHDIEHPQGTALGFGDVVMVVAGSDGRGGRGCGGETGKQGPG
jgi:hypothetical protein